MLTLSLSKPDSHPSQPSRKLRIDAHHHLWLYSAHEFGWIDDSMAALRRDFLFADLKTVLQDAGIDLAITVQARQTLEETAWLLNCANQNDSIAGVIGWAPLLSNHLSASLEQFRVQGKLLGLREIVQGEAGGYLDQSSFNLGIAELTRCDLAYDLLIRRDQLREAIRLVDRHPHQRFVLDHAAKPCIAAKELEPWRKDIFDLARRENVMCKLSGLVTEASWSEWTLDSLRPYLDTCVDAFGPGRLMAGSDWPVCLVATTYAHWWNTLRHYLAPFSESDRDSILGSTAYRFYKPARAFYLTHEAQS